MPLLLLAWVICAPAFLKCFKVFPLCEFSGNTHYLPGCHNTVFADWVTSALVIQKPLFSEQIATENDNGSLQTGENKTVFPFGLVTRVCKMSRRHMWGSNPNLEWDFWRGQRPEETWKRLNVSGWHFLQQFVPHLSIFLLSTSLVLQAWGMRGWVWRLKYTLWCSTAQPKCWASHRYH